MDVYRVIILYYRIDARATGLLLPFDLHSIVKLIFSLFQDECLLYPYYVGGDNWYAVEDESRYKIMGMRCRLLFPSLVSISSGT